MFQPGDGVQPGRVHVPGEGAPPVALSPEELIAMNPLAGYPDGYTAGGASHAHFVGPAIGGVMTREGVVRPPAIPPPAPPTMGAPWSPWLWFLELFRELEGGEAAAYVQAGDAGVAGKWSEARWKEMFSSVASQFESKRIDLWLVWNEIQDILDVAGAVPPRAGDEDYDRFVQCNTSTQQFLKALLDWAKGHSWIRAIKKKNRSEATDADKRAADDEREQKDRAADRAYDKALAKMVRRREGK